MPEQPQSPAYEFNSADDLTSRGYARYGPPFTVVALDPVGGGDDNAALNITERELWMSGSAEDPDLRVLFRYVCAGSWKFPGDTRMGDITATVLNLMREMIDLEGKNLLAGSCVAVECNGVGWGYKEQLSAKLGRRCIAITTTAGDHPRVVDNKGLTMPRQVAADHLRTLMETNVWKVRKGAPGADSLRDELMSFVWRGRRPEASPGNKDDQVLASIIAAWVASQVVPSSLQLELKSPTAHLN